MGGLPEVITDGKSGFLRDPDDLDGMAACAVRLLTDPALHRRIAAGGWRTVHERFCADEVVPRYEAFYQAVLERGGPAVREGTPIPPRASAGL